MGAAACASHGKDYSDPANRYPSAHHTIHALTSVYLEEPDRFVSLLLLLPSVDADRVHPLEQQVLVDVIHVLETSDHKSGCVGDGMHTRGGSLQTPRCELPAEAVAFAGV